MEPLTVTPFTAKTLTKNQVLEGKAKRRTVSANQTTISPKQRIMNVATTI